MLRPTHLRIDRDLPAVLALRAGAPRYLALKRRFKAAFESRRVIVFGSAVDMTPPFVGLRDVTVTVNGSCHNAQRAGIQVPDISFLLGFMTTRTLQQSVATYELLRGRRARTVIFVTGAVTMNDCLRNISESDYRFDEAVEVSALERAAMVGEACGSELGFGRLESYPSTGILAVACALAGGARTVVLAGFSSEPGHSYVANATRRHHRDADLKFLRLCAQRGLPLSTTSRTLAEACELSLVDSQ